jgi:hypothetical protein
MITTRGALPVCRLAILLLALPTFAQEATPPDAVPSPTPAAAPAAEAPSVVDMRPARVTSVEIDWDAARTAASELIQSSEPAIDSLTRLNAATGKIFANVTASGVPVLLPFDTAGFMHDAAASAGGNAGKYFSGFHAPTLFYPGPSGYDAAFEAEPTDAAGHELKLPRPTEVQFSASPVIYELDGPAVDQGLPVPELEHDFPGIRRVLLESRLRYTFTRFGVPYFVSILCSDGPRRVRHITCREADQVALRFIKALHVVGGTPPAATAARPTIERPEQVSADFIYYAPGDLLPGTGMQGHNGRADTTVYGNIRFPMERAPAYINSQSFMNWGNCDLTGLIRLGGRGRDEAYHCRVNDIRLLNDETKNYAYPWRDNFCEHRYYIVTQCPAGLGHQGEDIRPSLCKTRDADGDRCQPYQDNVVAVRDGVAFRTAGDEALYLVTNAPGEHLRFRYLHMNPHMLDLSGMVSGRTLKEGDVLGTVGDYGAREGGTSYHLHFNVQVPTRQGWLFVNPYMTLVASYERLIGGRGQAVNTGPLAAPATSNPAVPSGMVVGTANRTDTSEPKSETGSERIQRERANVPEHCATRYIKGHRRRVCWTAAAQIRGRRAHAPVLRAMDRHISFQSDRARHLA